MEQDKQEALKRGFNHLGDYYMYRVNLKRALKQKGICFKRDIKIDDLEAIYKNMGKVTTNKDFFFNKIFQDAGIRREGLE